ncbi:phosphoglycerate mutase [Emiliania huxleyi CCMP1516]|uniref:Phosphoglycerate mutase n=2 Tax=Emiliania huxleyi TaxID=2903 RepID=A0A0D3HZE6_EMIH1|nr:phosphoglycerate mutase [Emiliania huxleyi CCMP1516]EOD04381.1 phosphoglycerate mutase [Emiliania huxleyi CCMP1516]|eukprot:XP_005756810.1 phosphoglycerate mutase [Emiliania huxleyi CCMP1516]
MAELRCEPDGFGPNFRIVLFGLGCWAGDADAALAAAERELQIALAEAAAAREAASARKETAARAAAEEEAPHARLVLVRHGQSEWNLANRFTGWVDVDLTEQGMLEAREAGRLLAAAGLEIDEVHTSLMRRAIRSAVLMLSTLNQCWLPVRKHLELNEQHAGLLTGENKVSCAQRWGVDQCLSAVSRRVAGLWEGTIAPALREGRTVLVVTHGNTLRALVAYLDGLAPEDVYHVDLPTATPLLYEFDGAAPREGARRVGRAGGGGAARPLPGVRCPRERGAAR